MAFTVHADRQLIRAGARRRRFLCAEIQAPQAPPRPGRLPVNLAFVLDRSGSMDGAKIAHAREAVLQGLRSLRAEDRFAVVAYDDRVDLVVPTTVATPDAREAAAGIVSRIQPRGSTDLHGGWHRGCEQVAEHLSTDAVARCLLLTDGLANCGLTDHDEIVRRCKTWRERRVVTTAFGVGADFDETLLRRMADAGGGHFEFIASSVQIPDFVASEVGEALAIVAREAVLVVEAGEGTIVESLNDFPVRKDGTTTWRVEIGSLAGGQSLHPVLGVTFPANEAGTTREVVVRVEDAGGALGGPSARTTFTWASQEDDDRQPRDRAVDRRVAALQAARAERDALERNRARDFGAARAIVEHCVDHIREYAGDDPEILAVLEDLQQKADRYGRDLDGLTRKTLHYTSSLALKQRHMLKARRRQGPPAKVSVLASADLGDLLDPVIAHLVAADADLFGGLAFDPAPTMWTGPGPLDPAEEARLLDSTLARAVPAAIRVVFTTRALSDRWFSHWHESRGAAVVSLAGWGGGYAAPVEAFVAYEVILHGLRALGSCWLPDQWMHPETRGCLFDFCENRQDMELKLQAADLCPSCRATLGRIGLPLDRLANLLEVVRTLAVPATVVH